MVATPTTEQPAPATAALVLSRGQIDAWAGYTLTDEQFARLCQAVEHSSIPEAIATIADSMRTPDQEDLDEE